jgi:hypothetical protein
MNLCRNNRGLMLAAVVRDPANEMTEWEVVIIWSLLHLKQAVVVTERTNSSRRNLSMLVICQRCNIAEDVGLRYRIKRSMEKVGRSNFRSILTSKCDLIAGFIFCSN